MNREASIQYLRQNDIVWDVIVIGGGATGLGVALDATLRGYKTLLLEQADFTKGTSSRSTKLVHGGVRYLAQGNIRLVLEALYERGLLLKNAPHLVSNQSFIIPFFSWLEGVKYFVGLRLYDLLAGKLSFGKSLFVDKKEVIESLPTISSKDLKGGILYHDGQFDDARLGINLAQSCVDNGAHVLNYFKVIGLSKVKEGQLNGVEAKDLETERHYHLKAKTVINATGVFVDQLLSMDEPGKRPTVRASQGTHLVLDKSFLPSSVALMIPKTSDGRVLFALPWHDKVLVGTTDTLVETETLEPIALKEEVDFILNTFGEYLGKKPNKSDVLSVFSGLRPLARPEKEGKKTKEISRSHKLMVSDSGLVTITGGKWTTYRKMAEDTVDIAIKTGGLEQSTCKTKTFQIHGYRLGTRTDSLHYYGSDADKILELIVLEPELSTLLHPNYSFTKAEVVWVVRNEMARKVEDVLARRLRLLFVDAKAAISIASEVAEIMAKELGKNEEWVKSEIEEFNNLANSYVIA
jgi:glycerol-3-phosphate dehydrogenase